MMLGHEFERLQFYITNTSLSDDYNVVGNKKGARDVLREQGFKTGGRGGCKAGE